MPEDNNLVLTLKKVRYKGLSVYKNNVLFLSEGFTQAEEQIFNEVVENVIECFLNLAPFNMSIDHGSTSLKNCFNFFKAFSPSPSSGITVGVPVNDQGEPWSPSKNLSDYPHTLAEKDSVFGIIYEAGKHANRMGFKPGCRGRVKQVIENLRNTLGEVETAIPQCWLKKTGSIHSGKDNGLVCVLVNDSVGRAFADIFSEVKAAFVDIYRLKSFDLTPDKTDHFVAPNKSVDYLSVACTLAHEFGHSYFDLGDEYVNLDYVEHKDTIRKYLNVAHEDELDPLLGDFPDTEVKWLKKHTDRNVLEYMTRKNAPLRKYHEGDVNGNTQIPDNEFFVEYSHPFPADIIGLYQGADFSFKKVYRTAGRCLMRSGSVIFASSTELDILPADLGEVTNQLIYYIPEQKLLLYFTLLMTEREKQEMLALADPAHDPVAYNAYKDAIERLYTMSNDRKWIYPQRDNFGMSFCYVCKYYIVSKLTENFIEEARNKFLDILISSVINTRKRS